MSSDLSSIELGLVRVGADYRAWSAPDTDGLTVKEEETPMLLVIWRDRDTAEVLYHFTDPMPGATSEDIPFSGLSEALELFEKINERYKTLNQYCDGTEIWPELEWSVVI